jgi:CheY-like chemotaxis protein
MTQDQRSTDGAMHKLPEREQFTEWVHDALNRLYDSVYLQSHPLLALLADDQVEVAQRGQSVRRTLLQTIRGMRPHPGIPAQSPDWRAYRILELRYIEGLSPQEVMDQIALSRSHYFREQARVLDALVTVMWTQVQAKAEEKRAANTLETGSRKDLALAEAERLRTQAVWQQVDLGELVAQLETIIMPLAQARDAHFERVPINFSVPRADRSMLRQAILNSVSYAIDRARGGSVAIGPYAYETAQGIYVRSLFLAHPPQPGQAVTPRQGIGLEVCAQLMQANGGQLALIQREGESWEARLLWQSTQSPTLLVVDDNQSFISLFRRFLSGTGWQVVGANSGREAEQLLAELLPTVIILDVMMPQEDGWELLRRWRIEARTAAMPIIICSVLNEPHLALTLGASAYLPKPVTQQALLQVLSPWC